MHSANDSNKDKGSITTRKELKDLLIKILDQPKYDEIDYVNLLPSCGICVFLNIC